MKRFSGQKSHTNTRKFDLNISAITDAFLDQKKVNVREHMVKMAPRDRFFVFMAPSLPCVHIHLLPSDRERHL